MTNGRFIVVNDRLSAIKTAKKKLTLHRIYIDNDEEYSSLYRPRLLSRRLAHDDDDFSN